MVLSALLSLNTAGFTTGLGKAIEGVRLVKSLLVGLGDNSVTKAFDAGGKLSDMAAQLSEPVGELMVLRQAFQDTGVGADAMVNTLSIMRRALGGISEDGQPTAKIFQQLGLDINAIKGMSARDQLNAIGDAIRGLASPSEQSAAAMAIFGRSGVGMLTFFDNSGAIDTAAKSLGSLPALMERNANAFDAVSDRIGRIKQKTQGLWAGVAEGLLPLADATTGLFDRIDLTGIGQRIGAFLGTTVELFRTAPIGQTLKDVLVIAFGEYANFVARSFLKLGGLWIKVLTAPLSYLSAAFGKAIQEIMELIGRIPKVGEALGLDGFKAQTFADLREQSKDFYQSLASDAFNTKVVLIDTEDEKKRLAQAWTVAADAYQERLKAVQEGAVGEAKQALGRLEAGEGKQKAKRGSDDTIASDSLARVGLFVGGSTDQLANLARQTLEVNRQMRDGINRLVRRPSAGPAWA